jgi:CheY-like chemotaxis protein
LKLTVTDSGPGIPKAVIEKIFEPFFTTKPPGKGTGMGLAMVYGIIKNHGGFIRAYSEEGRGAQFSIHLPLSTSGAETVESENGTAPVMGEGRILVVDDEELVREMAFDMLIDLGYNAVAVANGREAVDYYSKHSEKIDLAIIDMVMPEMGGRECFQRLRELNPSIRAILSTGFGKDGAAQEIMDEGMTGFVQKPYRISELSRAVARALSS